MIREVLVILLLTVCLGLGSCTMAHTQVAPLRSPAPAGGGASTIETVAEVYANVYGYSFFGVPITSGAARYANTRSIAWFENATRVETVTDMVLAEARQQGATHVVDLEVDFLSEWIGWTLVFWAAEAEASATAIRVLDGPPPAGAIAVDSGD